MAERELSPQVPTAGTQRTICTFFAEAPTDEGNRVIAPHPTLETISNSAQN